MRTVYRLVAAGLLVGAVTACSDQLAVSNPNNPDEARALARPTDVENLIIGSFNTFETNSLLFGGVTPQIMCLGLENYSNLANSAMGIRSTIPRPPISNGRNDTGTPESYAPWLGWHRAARAAALGLDRANQPGFTFFPTNAAQVQRAKAFANFVIGIALGQVAMVYDSGSAINENDDLKSSQPLALIAYDTLARYALAKLDSAVAHANQMGTMGIPSAWMATTDTLTKTGFKALILAWKARIMASAARSPSDNIVNWDTVIADATFFLNNWTAAAPNGSGGDVVLNMNSSQNWTNGNMNQLYQSGSANWHEMHGFMIGMADTSGQYQTWLNGPTGVGTGGTINIVTGDRRFPQGGATCNTAPLGSTCRAAQQATAGLYFTNRGTGTDWTGEAFGNSNYILGRWKGWFNASLIGPMVIMSRTEIRMLLAEGQYHKGNYAVAAGLVDSSRVGIGGLPSLVTAGVINNTATLPGPSCVPRVPAPSGTSFTTSCGTLLEALKWEMRMESAYTWTGMWYYNARRWGDLPIGTALYFPVPYQESDARNTSNFYSTGGSGNSSMQTKGTYGL